jgi:biotin carboxyl carrier protein
MEAEWEGSGMKHSTLTVQLHGNDLEIYLDKRGKVLVGQEGNPLDIRQIGDGLYSLIVDRRQHVVHAVPDASEVESVDGAQKIVVTIDGGTIGATVESERSRLIRALGGEGVVHPAARTLTAPMPGLVVKVNVQVGQAIQPGASLLILEAMKMENEIRSVVEGIVEGIGVSAGQAVEKGEVLMTFK